MNLGPNYKRIALKVFVAPLAFVVICPADSPRNRTKEIDTLAAQFLEKLTEEDKKNIVILDLQPAFGEPGSFGSWFAGQLSSSFTGQGQAVKVIDRLPLGTTGESQQLSSNDELDVKNAIASAKAVGATTVVVGSYGAAENGIGVSLAAFRVSEYGIVRSGKFVIVKVCGKIPLTQEVTDHLSVALDSMRPKDGIYRSGYGGVSVPACIKCPVPSMHVPDIDLKGMLSAHPRGETVLLRFVVTEEGHTRNITVVQPVGFGFDEQYVKAAKNWEFKPAVDADNRPVAVKYDFQLSFNFR